MELTAAAAAAEITETELNDTRSPARDDPRPRLAGAFDRCADGLFRFILVRVGMNRHAAEDLIQQVCCEAARKGGVPDGDDACEAWLFGIARNRVRKYWRWRRRRNMALASESDAVSRELLAAMERGPLPGELLSRQEAATRMMLAITELPAADQQLLFAFYFDGRSSQEIAEINQTTAKGIESRLYRVRAKLRSLLCGDHER